MALELVQETQNNLNEGVAKLQGLQDELQRTAKGVDQLTGEAKNAVEFLWRLTKE